MSPPALRDVPGAVRFARYALAPNRLGYCGPTDDRGLLETAAVLSEPGGHGHHGGSAEQVSSAEPTEGLRALARGFEGAWPYLELIAAANRIGDPLDDRVVRAYWLGGPLLERVTPFAAGAHVEQRFRSRAGRWWSQVAAALEPGVLPSHAFHVMVVGPWVGMLRGGRSDAPLQVLDRCRIRRGRVVELHGDEVVVRTDRMRFGSGALSCDPVAGFVERVRLGEDGRRLCGPVEVGDLVAIHWDWVCEVLSPWRWALLGRSEASAIERANRALAVGGATELG